MDTIGGIIIGIVVSVVFFQFRHITGKYTDKEIADFSNTTSDIRFLIINWIIKDTDPRVVEVVDKKDDGADVDTSINKNKYIQTKEYDTKLIRVTLVPLLDNWILQVVTVVIVVGSFLSLVWLVLYSIDAKSYDSQYATGLIVLVQMIAFFILCSPLVILISCVSIFPLHCLIRQGTLSVKTANIPPIEQKKLKEIDVRKEAIFVCLTYKSYKILNFQIVLIGIGMRHKGETFPLIYGPRWLLKLFGCNDVNIVVSNLNNELLKSA